MYGDKTLPKYIISKTAKGRQYRKLNLEHFITKNQFIHLRYEKNIMCAEIANLIDFEAKPNTLRRLTMDAGRRKPVKTFSSNDNFFNEMTSESAWVLGWLITDGFISERYFKLDVQHADEDVLLKIKRHVSFEGNIYSSKLAKGIKIYNTNITESLFNLGIPRTDKTFTCVFPNIPKKFESEFMRGVFEGDGTIVTTRGGLHINVCGASLSLINSIQTVLISKGIETRLENRDDKLFVLHAKGMVNALKWLAFIYSGSTAEVRLDRKFNKFIDFLSSYNSRQRRISEAADIVYALTHDFSLDILQKQTA